MAADKVKTEGSLQKTEEVSAASSEAELFSRCFLESLGHDLSFYQDSAEEQSQCESCEHKDPVGDRELVANPAQIVDSVEAVADKETLQAEASSDRTEQEGEDRAQKVEFKSADEELQLQQPELEGADCEAELNCEGEAEQEIPKLRIVFAGMDGRFSTTALQVLAGAHQIVGIIHSHPRRSQGSFLERWMKAGKGEGNLKKFADYYGCPFFSAQREYNYELLRFVKHLRPDLICVSNFSIILPPDIFDIPKYGAINLHLAALPEYRGPNPWLWMFYDGCSENKYVVHQIDEGEDTGPILAENSYNIPPNVTVGELADCVLPNAACLMLRVVDDIALGKASARPQKIEGSLRRARYVKPGEPLINWQEWGAERVASFLRGASIWYEPFSIFPCLVRVYEPAVLGSSRGRVGTNHWRLWYGWISCRDGIVPYKIYIKRYEFLRLFVPLLLMLLLAVLF
ncbi:MAG: methionyl-tRNA formyltransferase [Candidatus Bruticola sp.]